MKRIRLVGTGIVFLVLGSIAPIHALQEQHEQESKTPKQEQQAKPQRQQQQKAPQQAKGQEKQQKQPQQAKPEKQQQEQKAPQQAKGQEKQQKQPQQAKPEKQQQQQKAAQQAKTPRQAKPAGQQRAQQAKPTPQKKIQQSRGNGGNGGGGAHGRISDDHYRASFGSSHRFHVSEGDFRNHRFQYGGYSFGFIDLWPADWLYTDDVYVEYIDGSYYMFDAFHPGIRISLSIF